MSWSTSDPDSPDTIPPTEYCSAGFVAVASSPAQLATLAVPKLIRPGSPPVIELSVTDIRSIPFSRNEILEPIATSVSTVPAGSGATGIALSELSPRAAGALVELELRVAVFAEVDPQIGVLAAVLAADRRADPLTGG